MQKDVLTSDHPLGRLDQMRESPDQEVLTEAAGLRAAKAACVKVGLPVPTNLELLRLGENALFADRAQGLVHRVARSESLTAKVTKELAAARWLLRENFPALSPRDDLPQPISVEGRLVTFWEYVPPCPPPPGLNDLARLLRALHTLPDPDFAVPRLDPFPIMRRRLLQATGVELRHVDFLSRTCDQVEEAFHRVVAENPGGFVHGDAHRGNLLRRDGRVLLLDYEAAAVGPREWDLIPTATAVDRFGLPTVDYAEFAKSYGLDVTRWEGYKTLRSVRELGMTTWLMQNVHVPRAATEFAVRMESFRRGDLEHRWHAL